MELSGQLHALVALTLGKHPRCLLDRRLGGPQGRSGRYEEEEKSFPCRESNPGRPADSRRCTD
jgi:hypothetical protein